MPGAEEQTNAKAALKLRDRFRNRRLADAKLPRRAEKKEPVSQYGAAKLGNEFAATQAKPESVKATGLLFLLRFASGPAR